LCAIVAASGSTIEPLRANAPDARSNHSASLAAIVRRFRPFAEAGTQKIRHMRNSLACAP
jgi:hypothetical protein